MLPFMAARVVPCPRHPPPAKKNSPDSAHKVATQLLLQDTFDAFLQFEVTASRSTAAISEENNSRFPLVTISSAHRTLRRHRSSNPPSTEAKVPLQNHNE